jgi:hypothetical protein
MLHRVRLALLLREVNEAEELLAAAPPAASASPAFLNLLGIVHEVRHEWRKAKRCYGRARRLDRKYRPAEHNLRRVFEQQSLGTTRLEIMM